MICNVKISNGISAFKDKIIGDRYTIYIYSYKYAMKQNNR